MWGLTKLLYSMVKHSMSMSLNCLSPSLPLSIYLPSHPSFSPRLEVGPLKIQLVGLRLEKRRKLPQCGLGRSRGRIRISRISLLKYVSDVSNVTSFYTAQSYYSWSNNSCGACGIWQVFSSLLPLHRCWLPCNGEVRRFVLDQINVVEFVTQRPNIISIYVHTSSVHNIMPNADHVQLMDTVIVSVSLLLGSNLTTGNHL